MLVRATILVSLAIASVGCRSNPLPTTTGADLATPTWKCPDSQGQACTVGAGACARSGNVMCTSTGTGSCSATPGTPDAMWHQGPAANGSWDWDCDGIVEYQYPSGNGTAPILDSALKDCNSFLTEADCNAPHWYYSYWNHWRDSCGHPVDNEICYWSAGPTGASCIPQTSQEPTQGCR